MQQQKCLVGLSIEKLLFLRDRKGGHDDGLCCGIFSCVFFRTEDGLVEDSFKSLIQSASSTLLT
jgi:hypothetical protein